MEPINFSTFVRRVWQQFSRLNFCIILVLRCLVAVVPRPAWRMLYCVYCAV